MAVSILGDIVSVTLAGMMLVNQGIMTVTPQHDVNSPLFLVNREWRIAGNYVPELRMANVPGQVKRLRPEVADALEAMYAACKAETKVTLVSVSGYREYDKQERIYAAKLKHVGQASLSSDANLSGTFGGSKGGKWLKENCWRFGFIIRYQEGWETITGYSAEPWHVRFVGEENAAKIHANEMPLEEFLILERKAIMLDLLEDSGDSF